MFDFESKNKLINLKFRLVPMIHIGSKEYYRIVFDNLNECDEIFYEGAYIKGINLYSKQYNRIASKLGLVSQKDN